MIIGAKKARLLMRKKRIIGTKKGIIGAKKEGLLMLKRDYWC